MLRHFVILVVFAVLGEANPASSEGANIPHYQPQHSSAIQLQPNYEKDTPPHADNPTNLKTTRGVEDGGVIRRSGDSTFSSAWTSSDFNDDAQTDDETYDTPTYDPIPEDTQPQPTGVSLDSSRFSSRISKESFSMFNRHPRHTKSHSLKDLFKSKLASLKHVFHSKKTKHNPLKKLKDKLPFTAPPVLRLASPALAYTFIHQSPSLADVSLGFDGQEADQDQPSQFQGEDRYEGSYDSQGNLRGPSPAWKSLEDMDDDWKPLVKLGLIPTTTSPPKKKKTAVIIRDVETREVVPHTTRVVASSSKCCKGKKSSTRTETILVDDAAPYSGRSEEILVEKVAPSRQAKSMTYSRNGRFSTRLVAQSAPKQPPPTPKPKLSKIQTSTYSPRTSSRFSIKDLPTYSPRVATKAKAQKYVPQTRDEEVLVLEEPETEEIVVEEEILTPQRKKQKTLDEDVVYLQTKQESSPTPKYFFVKKASNKPLEISFVIKDSDEELDYIEAVPSHDSYEDDDYSLLDAASSTKAVYSSPSTKSKKNMKTTTSASRMQQRFSAELTSFVNKPAQPTPKTETIKKSKPEKFLYAVKNTGNKWEDFSSH